MSYFGEMEMVLPPGQRQMSSSTLNAKFGVSAIAGPSTSGKPRKVLGSAVPTSHPASRKRRWLASYTAASPAPGDAAKTPFSCAAMASAIEFLTGENENQRSKDVKPTCEWNAKEKCVRMCEWKGSTRRARRPSIRRGGV